MEKDNLLYSRIRTLRSRKRIIKKDVEKQVRKKYKRHREVWKLRRNIPLIPLERPYQKGFVRFFVVRDDVKRSKDGDFFENLLKKINTEMYSDTRKFLKKKRKFGRRIYVEKEQKTANVLPWEWNNPKFGLTERERQYFVKREYYAHNKRLIKEYYEFIEPWRFVLRVKPNIITHYKPLDEDLEREYNALDSHLNQHKVIGIIQKNIYGKPDKWKDKYKRKTNVRKYFHFRISAEELTEIFTDGEL